MAKEWFSMNRPLPYSWFRLVGWRIIVPSPWSTPVACVHKNDRRGNCSAPAVDSKLSPNLLSMVRGSSPTKRWWQRWPGKVKLNLWFCRLLAGEIPNGQRCVGSVIHCTSGLEAATGVVFWGKRGRPRHTLAQGTQTLKQEKTCPVCISSHAGIPWI